MVETKRYILTLGILLCCAVGCENNRQPVGSSGSTAEGEKITKVKDVSKALDGATPMYRDKIRDIAAIEKETKVQQEQDRAVEIELQTDIQKREAEKLSLQTPQN